MDEIREAKAVLAAYRDGCHPLRLVALGSAGGLSGAAFWRLETPLGTLCLRRWPAGEPDVDRLKFIHAVLRHVHRSGMSRVPLPLESLSRTSVVESAGRLWELTPWLPGEADYREAPTREKLRAAFRTLAEFHVAAATFPHDKPRGGKMPAVLRRLEKLAQLRTAGVAALERAALAENSSARPSGGESAATFHAALAARAGVLLPRYGKLAPALARELSALSDVVPLQPCIGDIHDRHVLFQSERVSGVIDFGAMRMDNVATDVARLLGTMAGDDHASRQEALAAYKRIRPLSTVETRLVAALDRANVILGGVQWLEWLLLEGRQFDEPEVALARLDTILGRLARIG